MIANANYGSGRQVETSLFYQAYCNIAGAQPLSSDVFFCDMTARLLTQRRGKTFALFLRVEVIEVEDLEGLTPDRQGGNGRTAFAHPRAAP